MLNAQDLAQQARSALLAAGSSCPHYAAGELCAWTLLVAAAGDGEAAGWARRRWAVLLAGLQQAVAPVAADTLAERIGAYADAIGVPERAAPGERHERDALLEPDWTAPSVTAAPPPVAVLPTADASADDNAESHPDGDVHDNVDDLRALVRRCLLYGLQDAGVETLGDDEPFSDAGLDSLSAMPVALELERQTGLAINSELLYEYQTVAALAAYLGARIAAASNGTDLAPG